MKSVICMKRKAVYVLKSVSVSGFTLLNCRFTLFNMRN